VGTGAFSSGLK